MDKLRNLAISVNVQVFTTTTERYREFRFLAQYLLGITRINLGPHSEEEIRRTVLLFVEDVFLLDGTISEVCIEHFGGQPILFRDSVQRLKNQLDLANTTLKCFNFLANKLDFKELTKTTVRETLEADIAIQHSRWLELGRLETLAEFGDVTEFRAAYCRTLNDWHEARA